MELYERFEKYDDEFLKFERVEGKRSERPDLHAFIILDEMFPTKHNIISGAEHDEIYLNVEMDELNEAASDDRIIELRRCGVMISEWDCLGMFV